MISQRPLGVTFLAGLFTFIGGFSALVIFIEMIDSWATYGFFSIIIYNPTSLIGFTLYGFIPIMLYTTGVGLFMSRFWARRALLTFVPTLLGFYFFNIASNLIRVNFDKYNTMAIELFFTHFFIYLSVFIRLFLFYLPIIIYLNRPQIKLYFEKNHVTPAPIKL